MADAAVEIRWLASGLRFEGGAPGGPAVALDGDGQSAVSPVQAALLSLAACTAADVVEILGKMRLPLDGLAVWVEGDRAAEPPRRFTRVRLVYEVAGVDAADEPKVQRAVALSHEKYCSVLHTWRGDIEIETEIVLEQR
ncbi:MAG: OsmC family protein [Longimicrobiales bacterium]